MTALICDTHDVSGLTVIAPVGDVDLATQDMLQDCVAPYLTADATVAIDCSGINFIDSTGLRALVLLQQIAEEAGANLVLASIPPVLDRVLELSGTAELFSTTQLETLAGI